MQPFQPLKPILFLCTFLLLISSCKKSTSGNGGNPNGGDGTPAVTAVGYPVGNAVTKNIGAAGGSLTSEDGRVQLTIPPGALSANTDISIQAITNQCPGGIGVAYSFQPNGTKFATPALVRFNYVDSDVNGTDPYLLYLTYQDNTNTWQMIDSDKDIDTIGKTASFDISHFTDMSMVPYIQITADKDNYFEGESGKLTINKWRPFGATDDGPIFAAFAVPSSKLSKWTLSGDGSIKGNGGSATYTAPATISTQKTVKAFVTVQDTKIVRLREMKTIIFTNKTYSITLNLIPSIASFNIRLDLRLEGASDIYDDVYTDDATVQIQTDQKNRTVKSLGIKNDPSKDNPGSGTNGTTSAEWVPDGTGVMNIASVSGTFDISSTSLDSVVITFTHIGAKTPKFSYNNIVTGNYFAGGTPLDGFPRSLLMGIDRKHTQVIHTDELFDVTATVTPLP